MPADQSDRKLGQLVGQIVEELLKKKGEDSPSNDEAAQAATSNIAATFPIMAQMINNSPETVSDDMRAQFETLMKKQEEDNDERVMREERMIGLLEDIRDSLNIDKRKEEPEPVREPKRKMGSGLIEKLTGATAMAPTAVRVAAKGVELAAKGTSKLVQGAATAAGAVVKPAARLVKSGLEAGLKGLESMGAKIPGMAGIGKMLASTGGKLAASLVAFVLDAVFGFFKSDDWNVSKIGATIGGMIGGTFDNKILNMFVNAGKWAGLGAAAGSAIPVVGTLIGGIIGAIIGAITGFFGGEKIAKFADEFGTKFSTWASEMGDNIMKKMRETFSAENVGKVLGETFDKILLGVVASMNFLGEKLPPLLDSIKNGILSAISGFGDILTGIGNTLIEVVKNVWDIMKDPSKMYGKVKTIVEKGWAGLTSGATSALEATKSAVGGAVQYTKDVGASAVKHSVGLQAMTKAVESAPSPAAELKAMTKPILESPTVQQGVASASRMMTAAGNSIDAITKSISEPINAAKTVTLDQMAKAAVKMEKMTGYPANVILTQFATESGWGSKVTGDYNYFGITKAASKKANKFKMVPTTEDITAAQLRQFPQKERETATTMDGKPLPPTWAGKKKIRMRREFASYDSLEDAIMDKIGLITGSKRYRPAWESYQKTGNSEGLMRGIAQAGYATDRNYENTLVKISKQPNIQRAIETAGVEPQTRPAVTELTAANTTNRGASLVSSIQQSNATQPKMAAPQQPIIVSQNNTNQSNSVQLPIAPRNQSSNRETLASRNSRS